MKLRLYVELIDDKLFITMFNRKKLKRICALAGIHLEHEYHKNKMIYYVNVSQINLFINVMNSSNIDVVFLGKEIT